MTDDQILQVLMGLKGAKEGEGGYTMIEFARAVLAEAEAEQKIKIERGFMGTVARAALEECAAEAPPACAAFICAYVAKHYP